VSYISSSGIQLPQGGVWDGLQGALGTVGADGGSVRRVLDAVASEIGSSEVSVWEVQILLMFANNFSLTAMYLFTYYCFRWWFSLGQMASCLSFLPSCRHVGKFSL
jgi:hypothetical protein